MPDDGLATGRSISPDMPAGEVVELVRSFTRHRIKVILDGGWGVDALLGYQSRPHSDLDIVLAYDDVPRLRALLEAEGYTDVPRPDTRPINFVMGDDSGHLIDIHTFSRDRLNHPEQGLDYPVESLNGAGTILGEKVTCIDAVNMVNFHTGYALDENDYCDVKALCAHFGLEMPPEYHRFVKAASKREG